MKSHVWSMKIHGFTLRKTKLQLRLCKQCPFMYTYATVKTQSVHAYYFQYTTLFNVQLCSIYNTIQYTTMFNIQH